jgi:hypothetical protein
MDTAQSVSVERRTNVMTALFNAYNDIQYTLVGRVKDRADCVVLSKHNSQYRKLAEWCISNNVDPIDYMRTVSKYIGETNRRTRLPSHYAKDDYKNRFLGML